MLQRIAVAYFFYHLGRAAKEGVKTFQSVRLHLREEASLKGWLLKLAHEITPSPEDQRYADESNVYVGSERVERLDAGRIIAARRLRHTLLSQAPGLVDVQHDALASMDDLHKSVLAATLASAVQLETEGKVKHVRVIH